MLNRGDHARKETEESHEEFLESGSEVYKNLEEVLTILKGIPAMDDDEAGHMAELGKTVMMIEERSRIFHELGEQTVTLLRDGKIEQGHILEEAVEEAADKVDKEIESLMLRMEETIAVIGHETENLEHAASRNQLIFVIAATLFGFVAAFFLTMKIVRPIRKAVDFSQVVASETYQKLLIIPEMTKSVFLPMRLTRWRRA